jgi:hypothetical protein
MTPFDTPVKQLRHLEQFSALASTARNVSFRARRGLFPPNTHGWQYGASQQKAAAGGSVRREIAAQQHRASTTLLRVGQDGIPFGTNRTSRVT